MYAAFDDSEPEHSDAKEIMERDTLVISDLVLTEIDHLVQHDHGFDAAMQVASAINDRIADGQYKLAEVEAADLVAAHDVRAKYGGLELDLADAVGVVLAYRHQTNEIFTLDHRDFRAISPLTSRFDAFHVLPADADRPAPA